MKKGLQFVVWGTALIFSAVVVFLKLMGVIRLDLFSFFWPSIFILSGATSLFTSFNNIIAYLLIGAGTFLIVQNLVGFELNQYLFIPIFLILILALIVIRLLVRVERVFANKSHLILFRKKTETDFEAALEEKSFVCAFGSNVIDLRKHKFKNNVHLDITAVFATTKLILPKHVNVALSPTAFVGAVEANYLLEVGNKYSVSVNAFCIFGFIEVVRE